MEKKLVRQGSVSENFFAVSNASLILPKKGSSCEPVRDMKSLKFGGHLKTHLYGIIHLVRPQDQIKLVARLESWDKLHHRYLVIVSTIGRQDTEESVVLGIDFAKNEHSQCTIGLAMPIWNDMSVALDGDGGFQITVKDHVRVFKPVSVQAMWSALQALNHCIGIACRHNYYNGSLYLTWTCYYESRITSSRLFLNEWEYDDYIWSRRPNYFCEKDKHRESTETKIRGKLKQVMMRMNLDDCTSRDIREELEKTIDLDLKEYKEFIDEEMITILRQMDTASKIFDFLYLGSAWNAANSEELSENCITHILNITMEIDNYFPDEYKYKNIRFYDEPTTDLLHFWNDTYKFIKGASRQGGRCLVHCKMGISRSAATVTAFVMKEMQWSMEKALKFVSEKRPIVMPNEGFMAQLREYEGILKASSQRHNMLFRSLSENNLVGEQANSKQENNAANLKGNETPVDFHRCLLDLTNSAHRFTHKRSKSWTIGDGKFDDDAAICSELFGDEGTEPFSEPQNLSLKSTEIENGLVYGLRPSGSKRKKKFKRRHTEKNFAWQSSEMETGPRSDESMVANSDCGVPTHRFSWEQSTVGSSEDNEDSTHRISSTFDKLKGLSVHRKKESSISRKKSADRDSMKNSPIIDEVFEPSHASDQQQDSEAFSVRNLVKNIESKNFSDHTKQGLDTEENGSKDIVLPESRTDSKVPHLSNTDNPNSNNNNSSNIPETAGSAKTLLQSSEAEVIIIPMQIEENEDQRQKKYHMLSQNELRVIREVGMTFIGEIPSTDTIVTSHVEPQPKDDDTDKTPSVRKGLVRKMARAIESRLKQSLHGKKVMSDQISVVDAVPSVQFKEKANPESSTDSQSLDPGSALGNDGGELLQSTVSGSSRTGAKENSMTCDGKPYGYPQKPSSNFPNIFSFVAPTPYSRFQRRFKIGTKSFRKSVSFDFETGRRGVSRSHSERSYWHRSHVNVSSNQSSSESAKAPDPFPVVKVVEFENNFKVDLACEASTTNDMRNMSPNDGSEQAQSTQDCNFPIQSNENRIDRRNSLYKTI